MPADWTTFIREVSDKLASQSIGGNAELADFISTQYCKATVGKAQSPFGNTHKTGRREILTLAFKKGFDELEKNPGPTFEEKEKDPKYADLDEKLPAAPALDFDQEREFLKWAKENPTKAPDFIFFQFFEIGTPYPKTKNEAAPYIAKRILLFDDGSSKFKLWLNELNLGFEKDLGKLVQKEYEKLTSGLSETQKRTKRNQLTLSKKIFQLPYNPDQKDIPSYLTQKFIVKFTFVPNFDIVVDPIQIEEDYRKKIRLYGSGLDGEFKKYLDTLQVWSDSLAAESESNEKEGSGTDPYEIMAKGVLDYWKSTLQSPLSSSPPVPPCVILAPGLGLYVPISYGNQNRLASYLRRSWNTGKALKFPGTEKVSSKLVATALAFSFAMHLLELKFLYRGGIPTIGGPAPMIGFVPFVF